MLRSTMLFSLAPRLVLQAFGAIERWPTWYPGVCHASWVAGKPWQPGAVMTVQVKNTLGMTVGSTATVIPSDDGRLRWENRAPALVTVCQAWVESTTDGSYLFLEKSYQGPATPLLLLLKARQQRLVDTGLANLRQQLQLTYHRT